MASDVVCQSSSARRRIGSATIRREQQTGVVAMIKKFVTALWVLLRDIYGQFFVLFMDTFIQ